MLECGHGYFLNFSGYSDIQERLKLLPDTRLLIRMHISGNFRHYRCQYQFEDENVPGVKPLDYGHNFYF
jgi:hypothetical protein